MTEAESVCNQFVDGVIQSLNSRFSDNADSSVMISLSHIFNPSVPADTKESDNEVIAEYLGLVGFEGFHDELVHFVSYLGELVAQDSKTVRNSRDAAILASRKKDVYPAVAEAASRFLIMPVSTVDCEQGFSCQNIIKISLRNSLGISALENLMRISTDGPSQGNLISIKLLLNGLCKSQGELYLVTVQNISETCVRCLG